MSERATVLRNMGGLTFDVVVREAHESVLEVTDNPVEDGVIITDHAFMQPLMLTISAGVTDTPLVQIGDHFGAGDKRTVNAYTILTELQRSAEPFTVQTGLKLYRNMVCKRLRVEQDKDTSNSLLFEAELREIIIVGTQNVKYKSRRVKNNPNSTNKEVTNDQQNDKTATPKAGKTSRQASTPTDRGSVKSQDVGQTTEPVKRSKLLQIFNSAGYLR